MPSAPPGPALSVLSLLVGAACGGASPEGGAARVPSRAGEPGEARVEVVAPGSTTQDSPTRVHGVVHFVGEPRLRAPLKIVQETAGCRVEDELPRAEGLVVEDGRLADVVVALRAAPAGVDVPPPPAEPALLDQRACVFVPHVSALQVGRVLRVLNSDGCAHNVHVIAQLNDAPNRTIAADGGPLELAFERAEKVAIRCDLHPWMSAWVAVFEHPWCAVSGADGGWSLPPLPPGEYTLEAWHEELGRIRAEPFRLDGGGEVRVTFTYGG